MRQSIALVFTVFALSACSKFEVKNRGTVDPDFQPFVDKFIDMFKIDTIDVIYVDIYYNQQSGNVIGVCKIKGEEKDIEIDPEWWSKANDLNREILMFHELGHCVLSQGHRNYELSDHCPGSIMDTYHIGAYCYNKHYDYYIDEMLGGER